MKNKLAGKVNIALSVVQVVYYVIMLVLTALGVYVPSGSGSCGTTTGTTTSEGIVIDLSGLGYAIGIVFIVLLLIVGIILGITYCILGCIGGKKLIESEETGRVPKVSLIIGGILKLLHLVCLFFIIVFLTIFPTCIPYIIVTVLVMLLIVVSIVCDCMVRKVAPQTATETGTVEQQNKSESYGFDDM